jgi:hypothetical protein
MAKKTKAKGLSFRQRLRQQAGEKLERLLDDISNAVDVAVGDQTNVNHTDLLRLMCGGQTKTLREDLVTQLANEKELELEAIYNKQMELIPEDSDADKKEKN